MCLFYRDENHLTPLLHAAKCGCYITVETLLDHGAKINAADKNNVRIWWKLNSCFVVVAVIF